MAKPLLFLDIDGVLCPIGGHDAEHVDLVRIDGIEQALSRPARAAVPLLIESFTMVWASAWGTRANDELAPLLGLPPLPHLACTTPARPGQSYKLADLSRFAEGRPCARADDEIGPDVHAWAEGRDAPTLLVEPHPDTGLEQEHVEQLLGFAERLRA